MSSGLSIGHVIQALRDVGMAVVAEQVVHASRVEVAAALDGHVPVEVLALGEVQLVVPGGLSEREVAPVNGVRPSEVVDNSILVGDSHVPDEGEDPSQHRKGAPDDAMRVLPLLQVDHSTHVPEAVLADYCSERREISKDSGASGQAR